jgi:hypothetical protein
MWPKRRWAYIFFSSHTLVVAFHVPPALAQSASVFAAVTSPAKAGPVKASASVTAKIEIRVFIAFSPLRSMSLNRLCGFMFQGKRPFLTGLLTVNRGYHDSWLMNPTNICAALSSAHGFLKHCRMLRRATRLLRWPRSGFIWPLKPERDKASSMTSGSYRDADRSRRQETPDSYQGLKQR